MKLPENPTITDVAIACCEKTFDNVKARNDMLKWLNENGDDAMEWELVSMGCDSLIHRIRKETNNIAVMKPFVHPKGQETVNKINVSAKQKSLQSNGDGLYGMWEGFSYHGKQVLSCTKEELLGSAQHLQASSLGAMKKSIFLEKLANGMNGKQTVRDRYTREQMDEIWKKAENECKKLLEVA